MTTDKRKVSCYITVETVCKLRVLAAMEGKSVSAYLEWIAEIEIDKAEAKGVRFDLIKGDRP